MQCPAGPARQGVSGPAATAGLAARGRAAAGERAIRPSPRPLILNRCNPEGRRRVMEVQSRVSTMPETYFAI